MSRFPKQEHTRMAIIDETLMLDFYQLLAAFFFTNVIVCMKGSE
jgi:hypothetical protein